MKDEKISLKHGAGGEAMLKLLEKTILDKTLEKESIPIGLKKLDDGAVIEIENNSLVLTTDSHTIKPLFFPGGDIGKLAVSGTINDVAVMGGKPIALASAIVLREGFPIKNLEKITNSMDKTAKKVGAPIVTGDTKVMERDSLDGMIITTTGLGISNSVITDDGLREGDRIIVTGSIGEHEASIIAHRENIEMGRKIKSDVNPIWDTIKAGIKLGGITAMKDPTRGGLAATLNEMASKSKVGILINEEKIPISESVRNMTEMLGIDPLQLTNEGKAIMGVKREKAQEILTAIQNTKFGKKAKIIGEVTKENQGKVILKTKIGGKRILRSPVGAPTPRIC
ncbi:MAG: hydrogenase expression/formation protein HypE [Candidatus Hadarchaeia archaeon]